MRVYTTNKALAARAHRALKYAHHNKVFLLGGEFWLVTHIRGDGLRYEIDMRPAVRRSIDDCTVAEWKRATAPHRFTQSWCQWLGGNCPVDGDELVTVIYRGAGGIEHDRLAGSLNWAHQNTKSDILWWRESA